MPRPILTRPLVVWSFWVLAAATVTAWLGLTDFAFSDYDNEASAAVQALITGHPVQFLELSPAYGGSLLLRAPFALSVTAWGGGELAAYRMLAVPCLLSAAALAVWLVARRSAADIGRVGRLAVIAVTVASPITLKMLEIGHPEEMLTGVLCVVALLLAAADRPTLAGIVLGLAIGAKAWALVAVGPVILAAPSGRLRIVFGATATAALLMAPVMLAKLATPTGADPLAAAGTGPGFQPWQAWWFLGKHEGLVRSIYGVKPGYRTAPEWLSPLAHPGIVLVVAALSALFARRRPQAPWQDVLLLLALVLLLRGLLDPWNTMYYTVPFLLALTTWEVTCERRTPVLSLVVAAAAWLTFQTAPKFVAPDLQAVLYLAWSGPLAVALWHRTFAVVSRPECDTRRGVVPRLKPQFARPTIDS